MAQRVPRDGGIDRIAGVGLPRDSVTLLHISDMQFGRNHRFGRPGLPGVDANFDTLLWRLTDDLKGLRDGEHKLQPDLLVVSGDDAGVLLSLSRRTNASSDSAFVTRNGDGYRLRDQAKPQSEWLAAIAADQTFTELRRGGPTRPPIRPRMEMTLLWPVS